MPKKITAKRVRMRCKQHGKVLHSVYYRGDQEYTRCLRCKKESRDRWYANRAAKAMKKAVKDIAKVCPPKKGKAKKKAVKPKAKVTKKPAAKETAPKPELVW